MSIHVCGGGSKPIQIIKIQTKYKPIWLSRMVRILGPEMDPTMGLDEV